MQASLNDVTQQQDPFETEARYLQTDLNSVVSKYNTWAIRSIKLRENLKGATISLTDLTTSPGSTKRILDTKNEEISSLENLLKR